MVGSGCGDTKNLTFALRDHKFRDPAYALLDSGATHALAPTNMLPKGARAFEVTINLAIAQEKAGCWRNEAYAEGRAHPLLPLGRLANLPDAKFVSENGCALMQFFERTPGAQMQFEATPCTMGTAGTPERSV